MRTSAVPPEIDGLWYALVRSVCLGGSVRVLPLVDLITVAVDPLSAMPLVSVIIPTYNCACTILRAIESALGQTHSNLEVIIIDDSSTDNTIDLLRSEFAGNGRVRFFTTKVNSGPAHARNLGISFARGEWIALLDADDAWLPDRLENILLASRDFDLVADNILAYDWIKGKVTGRFFDIHKDGVLRLEEILTPSAYVNYSYLKPLIRTRFIRRSALKYNEELSHGEDLVLYCEALCKGGKFFVVGYAGYLYTTRIGAESGLGSPFSRTVFNDGKLVEALAYTLKKHQYQLSKAEMLAFKRRMSNYANAPYIREVALYKRNRRYFRLAVTLMRRPQIWRMVAQIGNLRYRSWWRRHCKR